MTSAPSTSPEELATVTRPPRYRRIKQVGTALGLLLLIAAVVTVLRQTDTIAAARLAVRDMPAAQIAMHVTVLLASVALNVVLTGALFSLLISRYGRVGRMEMQALISAATLLNYIPLRPGLFGRLAYHRAYNNIPLTDSVKTVLQAALISAIVSAYVVLASLLAARGFGEIRTLAFAPFPVLLVTAAFWPAVRIWLLAGAVRLMELLLIAARYHAAFALIGSPIDTATATTLACVSTIASMVPFLSNGLGLREWAVGLLAPLLAACDMTQAMTADLVNRAAELLIVLIAGLAGLGWLMQHRRATHARRHASESESQSAA
jgi:hypothetical protein